MAFQNDRGGRPLCPSIAARNIATLIAANLHPLGVPESWSGNPISTTLTLSIAITTDEDGCPTPIQPCTRVNRILRNSSPSGNTRSSHGNKSQDSPQTNAPTYFQTRKFYGQTPTFEIKSPTLSKKHSSISVDLCKKTPPNTFFPSHSHSSNQTPETRL